MSWMSDLDVTRQEYGLPIDTPIGYLKELYDRDEFEASNPLDLTVPLSRSDMAADRCDCPPRSVTCTHADRRYPNTSDGRSRWAEDSEGN